MSVNNMVMAAAGAVTVVAGSGWIAKLDTASSGDVGRSIAVDGYGNVYVTGVSKMELAAVFIAKYDTSGAIQWQRKLDTLSTSDAGLGIAVDGSGNVCVIGRTGNEGTTGSYIQIFKYNTSGVLQWQRKLDFATQGDTGYGIAVDTSGNVHVIGQFNASTIANSFVLIAKLPADGTIPGTGTYVVGGSTLTYSASTMTDSAGTLTDSAGTLTSSAMSTNHWIVSLDTTSVTDVGYGIAVDGSGNVYVTGQANATINAYVFIAKYNSAGTIQWQRKLDVSSQNDCGYGIAVDGSGNVYVTGQANGTATTASCHYKK